MYLKMLRMYLLCDIFADSFMCVFMEALSFEELYLFNSKQFYQIWTSTLAHIK